MSTGPSGWSRMVRHAGSTLALDDGLLRRLFRRSPRVSLSPMVAPQSWVKGVVPLPNPGSQQLPFAALQAVADALDPDAGPGDLFQGDGEYKAGEGARLDAHCADMTT